jgi:hypothetical protein
MRFRKVRLRSLVSSVPEEDPNNKKMRSPVATRSMKDSLGA